MASSCLCLVLLLFLPPVLCAGPAEESYGLLVWRGVSGELMDSVWVMFQHTSLTDFSQQEAAGVGMKYVASPFLSFLLFADVGSTNLKQGLSSK